jgi:peptide/nickel transport system ATP-binding protein/oligopeptide transport system ATP-binding protein
MSEKAQEYLVEVKNLVKYFPVRAGLLQRVVAHVQAVDDVSFAVKKGETLGLVGESGCGKTTVGRSMLRLVEPTSGEVSFDNQNVLALSGKELKAIRRDMQIIFQDPYASLDPRVPIGESVMEGLRIHKIGSSKERFDIMIETLKKVGLEDYHARRYPHEFSGGQRQRIGIARALALRPKFIICDEPVSALDVSIQSQVLNILKDLQQEFGLTYLFIAHNLSVVEHISDRVAVMYLGKIVELTKREELFSNPLHPYTQALMSAYLERGCAQPVKPALRLPFPPALSDCRGCLLARGTRISWGWLGPLGCLLDGEVIFQGKPYVYSPHSIGR